jgi:hypothetical protein
VALRRNGEIMEIKRSKLGYKNGLFPPLFGSATLSAVDTKARARKARVKVSQHPCQMEKNHSNTKVLCSSHGIEKYALWPI